MNRYKWLAQYVLRMRNKEIPVKKYKYGFGVAYSLPRLTLAKEDDFLGDDYYLKFAMYPKSCYLSPTIKSFRISKENYDIIKRSFE